MTIAAQRLDCTRRCEHVKPRCRSQHAAQASRRTKPKDLHGAKGGRTRHHHIQGGLRGRRRLGGRGNAAGGPQTPAKSFREGGGEGGEKQGIGGSTQEVTAEVAGAAAGEVDTSLGHQWGRSTPGEKRGRSGTLEACKARTQVHTHAHWTMVWFR